MCHGEFKPKSLRHKEDEKRTPKNPYNRTSKHKPNYEYYKEDYY